MNTYNKYAGRDLNPRPSPCQEPVTDFWKQYKYYLSGLGNRETTNDRIAYAKKYYRILQSGNASELLSLTADKRVHATNGKNSFSSPSMAENYDYLPR